MRTKNTFKSEKEIYEFWERKKLFFANPKSKKPKHSLLIPPPNLTGELHLGHAMQHSILDAVARFKRLQGFDVLLLPGVDHAGIQFEAIFEKEMKKKNLSKEKLGREEWLKRAWKFKDEIYNSVSASWRMMGLSADWSREVFTLDEGPRLAVFEQFKTYFEKDLIYKGPYIVQWCPKCNTAIEDVEVEYEARKEKLYYLKYGPLTLATVRPETKFGDTAMAVNPRDKRYRDYVGKEFEIETLVGKKKMKIVADDAVDPKFGTGVIKVTPGHDFVDYEIGKRHNLPILHVVDKNGKLTSLAGKYAGMKVAEARKAMIPELKEKGILVKEEDYVHNVAICERCKTTVEPIISDEWFVKVDGMAKDAIKVIRDGKINFLPKNYAKILVEWLENIHDWCISRSLWWGHRIPVWHCNGKNAVGKKMGFARDIVPQLFTGKTKTYRLKDKGFVVGDRVAFEDSGTGKVVGFGTITNAKKTTVGKLPLNDPAHGAVYKKIDELISAFKKHYPELKVSKDTDASIYEYEFTSREKSDECCGLPTVSLEKPQKCPKCGCEEMKQDEQVLDTWFSSGLWPLSTLGWGDNSQSGKSILRQAQDDPESIEGSKWKELSKYFPWSFEISAPEIKYLWIARMIMISVYFTSEIPFKTMFFHGMLRDLLGRKFSKSLGNGIEPQYLIDKWGVDATRMALYTYSIPGRDGRVSREILDERGKNFRNFATKIRNIARFILELRPESVSHSGGSETTDRIPNKKYSIASLQNDKLHVDDIWIKEELEKTIAKVTKHLEKIELHLAASEIYEFVWHKFADRYIESSKTRRTGAQPTLAHVLFQVLLLLHPFMPFLTEEIYQKFDTGKKSIMMESWPKA